jgi:hypothetical protein
MSTPRSLLVILAALAALSGAAASVPSSRTVKAAPALPSPTAYAGSAVCADCHDDEHTAWTHDWHSRALNEAKPSVVVGNFADAHYKGDSSEAWMSKRVSSYVMRTQGPTGGVGDFPVNWVIGGKRMQDPVTILTDGRWQVLPVYFHVTGKGEWVDYSELKQGALRPDHPFFWSNFRRNVQHECLDCHTTGLDVKYDRDNHRWSTRFADAGVACESCHGPGARHAETQAPRDLVNPKKLPADKQLAVCAQCHGPRRPLFPMLDAAHHFRPGQRYEDFYQPMVLLVAGQRSGDFFNDGRPSTSSFEYQALLQSKCHLKGGATCLTCHTAPHASHAANELKQPPVASRTVSVDSASCQGCHAAVFAQGERHTHHTSAAAQDCVACHMPPVVTGVLDTFPDHSMDVPVPENTAKHGIPNACNVCHAQQTPEAMGQALLKWWPKAGQRQQRRLRLAEAFDEKTAAKSRALLEAVLADKKEAAAIRGVAAQFLARRFKQEAVPALKVALTDADPLLRSNAVEAFWMTGAKDSAGVLVPLLKDKSLWVRQLTALVLGSFGDAHAPEVLDALAHRPESEGLVQPHVALGQMAARRGDLPSAIQELERSLDLQPYNADVLVQLADLYAKQGDWVRTRARVEEALRFDPLHRGARQRLASLQGH